MNVKVNINFENIIGRIKPMHAVNNAPIAGLDQFFHYVKEAGFPFSRLHDTGGAYGGGRFVDIHNIFRNFDAPVDDPSSYDFAFTDALISSLIKNGAQPFFRLGESIENFHNIKAYYIYPPKDFYKWAQICEYIIRHYNEGWANGFYYDIKYWEIWNEPDNGPENANNAMWQGTFEEYMELYKVTSLHLRNCFPDIKIGGYSSCGFYHIFDKEFCADEAKISSKLYYFVECFEKFLKFAENNKLPLDFLTWHSYSSVDKNILYAEYVRNMLDKHGFVKTENILAEWNPGTKYRGTLNDAANIAENMHSLQKTSLDMAIYYNGAIGGSYGGLYNPITYEPHKAFYVFKAFNELYKLKNQLEVTDLPDGMTAIAAGDNNEYEIMITNKNDTKVISLEQLKNTSVFRLNEDKNLELCQENTDYLEIAQFETILIKGKR